MFKQFVFIIFTLVNIMPVYAETLSMQWLNEDGSVYTTSTCESGGDVILPATPTKNGYTFMGWVKYYTPIEYLESTGTQYIETDYIPNSTGYIATGKIRFVGNQSKWAAVLGGHHCGGDCVGTNKFGKYNTTNKWTATFGAELYSDATFNENEDYSFEISFITRSQYLKINKQIVISATNTTSLGNSTILLFTYNGKHILDESMKGRIYNVQIYDYNNTLVRDFIPVLDYNGIPCMYDKVTKQFFYNAGTGDFIAGPVLNE